MAARKSFLVGYRIITGFVLLWCLGSLKTFPGIAYVWPVFFSLNPLNIFNWDTKRKRKKPIPFSIETFMFLFKPLGAYTILFVICRRQTGWIAMNFYRSVPFLRLRLYVGTAGSNGFCLIESSSGNVGHSCCWFISFDVILAPIRNRFHRLKGNTNILPFCSSSFVRNVVDEDSLKIKKKERKKMERNSILFRSSARVPAYEATTSTMKESRSFWLMRI